jgi:hypothetical protein
VPAPRLSHTVSAARCVDKSVRLHVQSSFSCDYIPADWRLDFHIGVFGMASLGAVRADLVSSFSRVVQRFCYHGGPQAMLHQTSITAYSIGILRFRH